MFINALVLTVLGVTFFITLLEKWGIREDLAVHGSEFVSDLVSCNFCLGFWLSLIVSSISAACTGELVYLVIPIFSAPVINKLL